MTISGNGKKIQGACPQIVRFFLSLFFSVAFRAFARARLEAGTVKSGPVIRGTRDVRSRGFSPVRVWRGVRWHDCKRRTSRPRTVLYAADHDTRHHCHDLLSLFLSLSSNSTPHLLSPTSSYPPSPCRVVRSRPVRPTFVLFSAVLYCASLYCGVLSRSLWAPSDRPARTPHAQRPPSLYPLRSIPVCHGMFAGRDNFPCRDSPGPARPFVIHKVGNLLHGFISFHLTFSLPDLFSLLLLVPSFLCLSCSPLFSSPFLSSHLSSCHLTPFSFCLLSSCRSTSHHIAMHHIEYLHFYLGINRRPLRDVFFDRPPSIINITSTSLSSKIIKK